MIEAPTETFLAELEESIEALEVGLLALEEHPDDSELLHSVFRAAHTIKGAAGLFGLSKMVRLTHALETILDQMRDGERAVSASDVALLLEALDELRFLADVAADGEDRASDRYDEVIERVEEGIGSFAEASVAGPRFDIRFAPRDQFFRRGHDPLEVLAEIDSLGIVRVRVDLSRLPPLERLDPLDCHLAWDLHLETFLDRDGLEYVFDAVRADCEHTIRDADSPPEPELVTASGAGEPTKRTRAGTRSGASIRVSVEKLESLLEIASELVITQSMLAPFETGHVPPEKLGQLREGVRRLSRNTRQLQESVMGARMLPVSNVFSLLPRMVRDLSGQLGKEVELVIEGGDTELDKTILEQIKDPLMHIVRNSMDHGLEKPELRIASGKAPAGRLTVAAGHENGAIAITISDDGRGIDRPAVLRRARERGLIADEPLADEQIDQLLFLPGFSTAASVSDLSGRGVGMDVVRQNVERLGGSIVLSSRAGAGTTISLRLPLTLAILDGQLVASGEETFVIPLTSISESIIFDPDELDSVCGRGELYALRGESIPVVRLDTILGARPTTSARPVLVVLSAGRERRFGVLVDRIVGRQQVVIKSLRRGFGAVDGISGATILGDGRVALIVDVPALFQMSLGDGRRGAA